MPKHHARTVAWLVASLLTATPAFAQLLPKVEFDEAVRRAIDQNPTIAEATTTIARAEGDATRFSLLVDQYKGAPEVTRKRMWLDTVQDVLAKNRTVVGASSRQLIYVPMTDQRNTTTPVAPPMLPPELLTPTVAPETGDVRPGRSTRPTGREEVTR